MITNNNEPDGTTVRTHPLPMWKPIADTFFFTEFDDAGGYGRVVEYLWAESQPDNTLKVCCIPAFTYDLSLGDIIEADADNRMTEVVHRGGHSCLRIWSEEGWYVKFDVLSEINRLGGSVEPCTFEICAIDAPVFDVAWLIRDYLTEQQKTGRLEFEIGRWTAGNRLGDDPSN